MNLNDALLCIDCDEVFTTEGAPCNPRCPTCGSSVFALLSAWVQPWATFERSQRAAGRAGLYGTSTTPRRMEIVRRATKAA